MAPKPPGTGLAAAPASPVAKAPGGEKRPSPLPQLWQCPQLAQGTKERGRGGGWNK